MAAEVHAFQTKVSKLLKLLANSLYSNKEVFLRELVSNASDAIDKLRFESISHPELLQGDPAFAVRIRADKEAGTLTISDNGIGMTLEQAARLRSPARKTFSSTFPLIRPRMRSRSDSSAWAFTRPLSWPTK